MTKKKHNSFLTWIDGLAVFAWGNLLLKYAVTGQYKLLIHPNYYGLVVGSGILLVALSIIKLKFILARSQSNSEHISLFPPGLGSVILSIVAISGFLIPPKILTSQTANQRAGSDLTLTSSKPQAFRTQVKPEERSLIDWIRTINAYPEPDAYAGQQANITGFVLQSEELPDGYLVLSQFVITCCAVDAYPIGIPVKLETNQPTYPPDTWLQIQGEMMTETLPSRETAKVKNLTKKRSLVLAAKTIDSIPTPADPYSYK